MIYFEQNLIKFPRHFSESGTKLTVINEMTGDRTELDFTDQSNDDRFYEIDLSNLTLRNGNYKYMIGPEIGLMQVGDYQRPASAEYDERKQNIVYER